MSFICIFDLETTGPVPAKDHIVQVCIKKIHPFTQKTVEFFCAFVRSPNPIPAKTSQVNGITEQDLTNAPTFASIAEHIHRMMHRTRWCGHNVTAFDIPLLLREFDLAKVPRPTCDGILDTLILARALEIQTRPFAISNSLENLARHFGLIGHNKKQTHQADDDVELTHQILQRLCTAAYIERHMRAVPLQMQEATASEPHPMLQMLRSDSNSQENKQHQQQQRPTGPSGGNGIISEALRDAINKRIKFPGNPTRCGIMTTAGNQCRFRAGEYGICQQHMARISSDLIKNNEPTSSDTLSTASSIPQSSPPSPEAFR